MEPVFANTRPKKRLDYKAMISGELGLAKMCVEIGPHPSTYDDAVTRPDPQKWIVVMEDGLVSPEKFRLCQLVKRPDENVNTCRLVFKTKRDPDNTRHSRERERNRLQCYVRTCLRNFFYTIPLRTSRQPEPCYGAVRREDCIPSR